MSEDSVKILNAQMKENFDYQLIPLEDDLESWGVRFLRGDWIETVVRYDAIALDQDEKCLKFNFTILKSPQKDISTEDRDLQIFAGKVLESVIESGLADGSVELQEEENKLAN